MVVIFNAHYDFTINPYILIGNILCSVLSLISCVSMVLLYYKKKKIRSLIHSLIICIACSEIVANIGHIMSIELVYIKDNEYVKTTYCTVQSILIFFGDTTTMIFLVIITACIYQYIIKQNSMLYLQKWKLIILGLVISIVFTLVIMSIYLNDEHTVDRDIYMTWCWIKNKQHNAIFITVLVINVFLVLGIMILILIVYCYVKRKARELGGEEHQKSLLHLAKKLMSYPIIGACGWALTLITWEMPFRNDDNNLQTHPNLRTRFEFLAVEGMYMSLRGFFISLLFFSGDKVKKELYSVFSIIGKLLQKVHQGLMAEYHITSDSRSKISSYQEQINQNDFDEGLVKEN